MEKLFELPPLAMVVFGVTLALIFAVRHLGLWQGQNTPPPVGTKAGRILGAVIGSKKADELIAVFGRMSVCLEENTKALHESTHTAGAVETEMRDASTDIRELTREIVRSGK